MYMKNKKIIGFTLVELIIVISIIAVLSTLAFISLQGEPGLARDARRKSDLKTLQDALSMSAAKRRPVTHLTPSITTNPVQFLSTSAGEIRVLRNATAFEVGAGMIDSSILGTVSRDPRGAPYLIAFLSDTIFQIGATLENPVTKIEEALIRGSFQEEAVLDTILSDIDNNDRVIPVSKANQFIRGDIIQIGTEKILINEVSAGSNILIVTRGYGGSTSTVHTNRESIKIVSFATDASSLFCEGGLVSLAPTGALASDVIIDLDLVPVSFVTALTDISLDTMYTCSPGKSVQDEGLVVLYTTSF
jgi:prepilin-type N-terminal cleavage/methylation domain-containing protein